VIPIRATHAGSSFAVRLHPRARKNAVTGTLGDALKISLTAPPAEGKANQACIALLSEMLGVAPSSVTIAAGESSRNKIIQVAGLKPAQVAERLAGVIG
jgi:uncharacterized protein (TIGR00251 family)